MGIWKPPPSTCTCRSGTCRPLRIRWRRCLFPAPKKLVAVITARNRHDAAGPRSGRHPPRARRPLPGSRSIQLYFQQHKAFRAIQRCRTAALGGHVDVCSQCGRQEISYNSCRNRNCPKCQTQARQRWLAARERELLPTNYFHVVFTVPHELNVLALDNPRLFYDLLFTASAQTLLEVSSRSSALRRGDWRDEHSAHLGAKLVAEPSLRMPVIIISFVFNE